ncbi:hypothetical protein KAH55_14800, partial [bacterium]|nr:hypothetical protein [bacterium]
FRFYLSAEKEIYNEGGSGDEADLIADLTGKKIVDWKARKRLCADRLDSEIKGITDILARDHVQYDVLWDNHVITRRLGDYQVLVLPNNACISATQRQAIRDFVENGGTLIADFECGFYDETGTKSENGEWLNFLGIEKTSGCFAPSLMEDYISFTAQSPLINGFQPKQMAPRPELCLKITPLRESDTPTAVMNPVGLSYQELTGPSEFSAMHSITRGKGKIVYFSGLIGDFYFQRKMPAWERLLQNALNMTDARPFTITAPASVICDMSISNDGNSYFFHLVNCSGDMQRPIQEFIPIHDIQLTVPELPTTATARSLRQNSDLSISRNNGTASIVLPRLEQYDVIQINKK